MVLGLYMQWIDDDVVMTKVDAVIIKASAEEQNLVTPMHGVRSTIRRPSSFCRHASYNHDTTGHRQACRSP